MTAPMEYDLIDVDLADPLPHHRVSADASGLGIVARWQGVPVGFVMAEAPPERSFDAEDLTRLLAGEPARAAVARVVRERLVASLAPEDVQPLPSLTIAICTHNGAERLRRLLSSVAELPREDVRRLPSVAVLVVDNAPPNDDTRAAVAEATVGEGVEVRCVVEPRVGLDFARNRAVAEVAGGWIAFVDDDVTLDRGWLAGLVEVWHAFPDAVGLTGLVLPMKLDTEARILFEQAGGFRRGFELIRFKGPTHPGRTLYPVAAGSFGAGANMAFRRETVLELGGFDEALDTGRPLPGGGDLDIFHKVASRGGGAMAYAPRVAVHHEHRPDLAGLRRQYESWGRGLMAYADAAGRRDPASRAALRRLRVWWLGYMTRRTGASLLGREPLPARMVVAEFVGGLRGLCGEYGRSRRRVRAIRERHAAGGAA